MLKNFEKDYSPIVLFVYNRVDHTKRTVEALKHNLLANKSYLYIYSDAAKNISSKKDVDKVRNYIRRISGFKKIIIVERKNNYGLAKSVIEGVSEVISKHGMVIVLEDDIVTSKSFLSFMNDGLKFYKSNKKIRSITGLNFPIEVPGDYGSDIYISSRPCSWGWATWIDRWKEVDWSNSFYEQYISEKLEFRNEFNQWGDDLYDMLIFQLEGKVNSWAIKWAFYHTITKSYCVYPVVSMAENIGTDGSGVHADNTSKYFVKTKEYFRYNFNNYLSESKEIKSEFKKLFGYTLKDKVYFQLKAMERFIRNKYEKALYCPSSLDIFINPFFLIRSSLCKNIKEMAVVLSGNVLDFGCGSKPYRSYFINAKKYIGLDILESGHDKIHKKADVYYDGKHIPFDDNSFDSMFSSEVFEHVVNLSEILSEIGRVLKPKGWLLVTVPFVWNEHEVPYDYQRFTSFGIVELFKKHDLSVVKIMKSNSYIGTIWQMMALFFYELSLKRSFLVRWFCQLFLIFPISLIGVISEALLPKRDDFYSNNIVLLRNEK